MKRSMTRKEEGGTRKENTLFAERLSLNISFISVIICKL